MLVDGIISLLSYAETDSIPSQYAQYGDLITSVGAQVQGRVYENELPRGYQLPAIAVHVYGGDQGYDMAGPIDLSESQLQLDIYGADSVTCRNLAAAARQLLKVFVGTLPDGTIVPGLFQERDMAMPFTAKADTRGLANRWTLGFRVVSNQM